MNSTIELFLKKVFGINVVEGIRNYMDVGDVLNGKVVSSNDDMVFIQKMLMFKASIHELNLSIYNAVKDLLHL